MPASPQTNSSSRWLLVAAILVVLIGLAFQFRGREDETAVVETDEVVVERIETAEVAEVVVEEPTPRREPTLPFTPRATRVERAETTGEPAAPENLEDAVEGEWRIVVNMAGMENEIGRATMKLVDENRVTIEAINDAGTLFPELWLDGYDVETSLVDQGATGDFSGSFAPDFSQLTLSGTVREDGGTLEMDVRFLFFKIDESYYEREKLIAQHRGDLEQVVDALKAYAADHGELPTDLDALVPDYLRDASAFASYDGRIVDYNPQARALPPAREMPWQEIVDAASMIAYEQEMEAYWGAELMDPLPVVTMSVEPLEVEFLGSTIYGVYQDTSNSFANYQGDDPAMIEARNGATRASCQNNMKQLGLSTKMFQNEHPEERYPAGVFMLYPEFIVDPRVLTCPSVEPGVLSYAFVYPAATDAELAEVYTQVTGNVATEPHTALAHAPMMVETHLCAADQGRNVLFVDGHVEFMVPEEFEAEMGPYLEVRLR